ncbi:lipopolysaccharide biosynthesis protein [Wenxinia marina]|uniref:Membrane protein involved in the export of O-antigen and teichoic acid n=1 Tax=Wenxinia marina DSM 24838 TaxID=1123501 RepID=A0A0D0NLX6_9RHOB|nr:lipopolysaccharide biosynthesis protein [Wenxinia marina]KIQ69280.1 Membrane protein involved in the export of O-antigen and teichoic acid [Wenxinia marina DSM 24838]
MFDPPKGPTGQSVSRGLFSTGMAQAIRIVLQMVSVIVLSRLLSPDDFGLVAMTTPIIVFMGFFQNLGLTQATVQRERIGHDEVNFLFWINIAASVAVALIVILISPLAAAFYAEPRIGPLIAAMALPVLLTGASAQHLALLNRRMMFDRLAIIETLAGVANLVVAIVWAWLSPTYWALWGASAATAVVMLICSITSNPWRPTRPGFASDGLQMVVFGADLTGFSLSNFFARNFDNVLIGRVWGGVELGYYERAYKLLLFPLQQITNPLSRVMVPTLSRMQAEPARYRVAYLRVIRLVLFLVLPGVAMGIASADILVPFLLGEQWRPSAAMFAALGFAGLVQPLNNPAGWLFISQGRSREFLYLGIATASLAVAAFSIGIFWGAVGVAVAYAISEYLKTPVLWWYVGRQGPIGARDILTECWPFVFGAHLAVGILWLMHQHLPASPAHHLIAATLMAYITVACVAALTASGKQAFRELALIFAAGLRRLPLPAK